MKNYLIAAAILLLAGCQTTGPQAPTDAPAPAVPHAAAPAPAKAPEPPPEPPQSRKDLAAGIDMYKAGNYNGAIKLLAGSADIAKADTETQLEALKFTAFSYCVTNRITLCRQQFAKAFKLDKEFTLSAGEKGHPLWTPAFEREKKAAGKKK